MQNNLATGADVSRGRLKNTKMLWGMEKGGEGGGGWDVVREKRDILENRPRRNFTCMEKFSACGGGSYKR